MGLLQPEILKLKIYEPILLLGTAKFANVLFHKVIVDKILIIILSYRLTSESESREEAQHLKFMLFVRQLLKELLLTTKSVRVLFLLIIVFVDNCSVSC